MQDPCCQMGPQMAPPPPPPPPPMQTSCTCITSEFIQIIFHTFCQFSHSYNPTKTAGHLFMRSTTSASSIWWWWPIPATNDGATPNGNGNGWRVRRRATANAPIWRRHDGPIRRRRNGNGPTNGRWPTNVHLHTKFVLLSINILTNLFICF